jgi:hypothetical protein
MKVDNYTPRNEAGKGWVRIGQYDEPRRRSVWARISYRSFDPGIMPPAECVELCAGREGDDAYVKVEPNNPAFRDLVLIAEYAIANLPEE